MEQELMHYVGILTLSTIEQIHLLYSQQKPISIYLCIPAECLKSLQKNVFSAHLA